MEQNLENGGSKTCVCVHHKMIPVLVILFAVTFILGEQGFFSIQAVNTIWPILLGLGGVQALMEDSCKCC